MEMFSKEIILVCGNICSGKGHFCSTQYPDYVRIGVSDVVRSLTKFTSRSQLSTTKDYDKAIAKRIIEMIGPHDKVIVDGIRQLSIIKALEAHFGSAIKDIIWLDVPEDLLRQRFANRKSGKDDMTFDRAIQTDKELGIGDVEQYIRANYKTVPYS
jgi:predicted kinase